MRESRLERGSRESLGVLWIVIALNVVTAAGLFATGMHGNSSALIATGLDNTSDALVYATGLLPTAQSRGWKRAAARVSGLMLLTFGIGVVVDAVHRYFAAPKPIGMTMVTMAPIAAAANLLSLSLLKRLRGKDANLSAAKAFNTRQVIPSGGVLLGGALVLLTGWKWPDAVVGIGVAALVVWAGLGILWDAQFGAEKGKED